MPLAEDLLDQANRMLSALIPSEADIRRATSNAYYGLFHFLVDEALDLFCPKRPPSLAAIVRRGFQHAVMKELCISVRHGRKANLSNKLKLVFGDPFEPGLVGIANAFVTLQQRRHVADYALHQPISVTEAAADVALARTAVQDFRAINRTDNAQAFLMSLLLHDQWRAD